MIDPRPGTTKKPVKTQEYFPQQERQTGPKGGDKPKSQRSSPDAHPVN